MLANQTILNTREIKLNELGNNINLIPGINVCLLIQSYHTKNNLM